MNESLVKWPKLENAFCTVPKLAHDNLESQRTNCKVRPGLQEILLKLDQPCAGQWHAAKTRDRASVMGEQANLIAGGQAKGFNDGGSMSLGGDALILIIVQPDLPGRSSHLQQNDASDRTFPHGCQFSGFRVWVRERVRT